MTGTERTSPLVAHNLRVFQPL